MVRTIIGGLVGGLILFVVGFIFWGSPLGEIPFTRAGDEAMAENFFRRIVEERWLEGRH